MNEWMNEILFLRQQTDKHKDKKRGKEEEKNSDNHHHH